MIDLRSDICAAPTEEMWAAMRAAPVGSAAFGEDGNVAELERRGALLLGHEAAVFVPTATAANIAAALTLAAPGAAVVLEASAHILVNEGDGIEALAGLRPHPLTAADGRLDPEAVAAEIARSGAALLCLENAHTRAGGTTLSLERTEALASAARAAGARVHLDGARLANAAVSLGLPLAALARTADTVSLSLNKGLCAPFGALLAGSADTVSAARVQLKRLGAATVHKAGIAAAAGLVAIDSMIERLADDHRRARELARLLAERGVPLRPTRIETNIVTVLPAVPAAEALAALALRGVLALSPDGRGVRLVTHRMIGDAEVAEAAYATAEVALAGSRR